MSRWEPDARGRLEKAAYELFLEHGYDRTTVADISKRARLTERTFFRHYADKREVLFGGSTGLQDALLRTLERVPPALPPIEAVRLAVEGVASLMHGRLKLARERRRIIAANPDLQERDSNKRAILTAALEQGLRDRSVPEPAANLAAELGIAVFYSGFALWLNDPGERELVEIVQERFDEVKAVAAGIGR